MKNAKKMIDIYIAAFLILLCGSAILKTIAYLADFNTATMHYGDTLLFPLSVAVAAAAIPIFAAFMLLLPKGYKLAPDIPTPTTYIPAGIVGVALLFTSARMVEAFTVTFPAYSSGTNKGILDSGVVLHYVCIILFLLSLASAFYFFLTVFSPKRISDIKAAFGMALALFLALYGIYLYFNKTVHPTNSPNKISDQLAYFAASIYFLFETRISLGRDMWKLYTLTGFCSALLAGYSAFPALAVYFIKGELVSDSIVETVLTLSLFLYISAKMIMARVLPEDTLCKSAETIEKMALAREEELLARRTAAKAHEYNYNEENGAQNADVTENSEDAQKNSDNAPTEGQISFVLDDPEE